ncbi:MAG: hypothetical protein KAI47_13250, partial [Deltaproteobacteria bacterium]|nr:hypothetical protein [Deltaproteobacteria bacterium]
MTASSQSSPRALRRDQIASLIERERIDGVAAVTLASLIEGELGTSSFLPDGIVQVDPRTQDRIIYSSARSKRPHDNQSPGGEHDDAAEVSGRSCVICDGKITGIVDIADLSEGFTFINKNLYPVLFPRRRGDIGTEVSAGRSIYGMHFLQWTSSLHDSDWHNMPQGDAEIVLRRLAALEGALLESGADEMPDNAAAFGDRPGRRGYVGIIKNFGALVGGSLVHGHQQIAYSSEMPRRLRDDWVFEERQGERYADFILRETPEALRLRDYGAATLLIPYFMRRPYDMQLVVHDTTKRYLSELDDGEIAAISLGLREGLRLVRTVMPR